MSNIWGHYGLKALTIWWFNFALCSLITPFLFSETYLWNHELTNICWPSRLRWRSNWNLFTVACNCSFLVIIIIIYFPYARLLAKISETAHAFSHQISHTCMDPYPTYRAPDTIFESDPDYHSGSRAKSVIFRLSSLSPKFIIGSSIAIPLSVGLGKSYLSSSLN